MGNRIKDKKGEKNSSNKGTRKKGRKTRRKGIMKEEKGRKAGKEGTNLVTNRA